MLGALQDLHAKGLDPSLLQVTSLKQKGLILAKAGVFAGEPGKVASEFADLYEQLRNPLVHVSQFVDDSLGALQELNRRLEFVRARTAEATAAIG